VGSLRDADFGIATGAYVAERDDSAAAVARARREGWRFLEVTAVGETRIEEVPRLDLSGFERVSVHAPVAGMTAAELVAQPLDHDLILHPDVWQDAALAQLGRRAVFENMDINKPYGRSVEDLGEVFERFPEAGFCLDVAHVWTNDPTLALGHDLLDAFGERLRQLHVSGIEPDGTHRETTAADLERYRPLLDRSRLVPWLLEAELAADCD
jgi:hypothetical protein